MPDARLQRTRATLPMDYQFGDAVCLVVSTLLTRSYAEEFVSPMPMLAVTSRWRPWHQKAAEQLLRQSEPDEPGYGAGV